VGLNVLPKSTYATDYFYKTRRRMIEQFIDTLVTGLPDEGCRARSAWRQEGRTGSGEEAEQETAQRNRAQCRQEAVG